MKYRMKFSKQGNMKWIGHLDLTRALQLGANRAGLPIAYSQGFNPHQLLALAHPLPLGMESVGEYAEIVLTEALEPAEIQNALNKHLPIGVCIAAIRAMEAGEKSAAAQMDAADYETPAVPGCGEILAETMAGDCLRVMKKTKSGEREHNIRPDIIRLYEDDGMLRMRLAAGSSQNLKPDVVLTLLYRGLGLAPPKWPLLAVKRLDLLAGGRPLLCGGPV